MEKGGTFYGGTRKQDVPQSLPKTKPSWGRKENEAAKQAGVERSIARLRTPRNWYSSDQGRGNIGDTRGQRKKSIEKTPVEGQGTSDPAGVFDASKPMPRPKVTGPDHPEGPGKRLINGFTVKEHDDMETADKRGVMRPGYPQDPDARPAYPQQPKPRVRKPYLRPSRAKKSIENSLLKLMKADEADVTIGGGGPGKEPKFKPMPPVPSNMMDITNPQILDHGAYDEQTGEGSVESDIYHLRPPSESYIPKGRSTSSSIKGERSDAMGDYMAREGGTSEPIDESDPRSTREYMEQGRFRGPWDERHPAGEYATPGTLPYGYPGKGGGVNTEFVPKEDGTGMRSVEPSERTRWRRHFSQPENRALYNASSIEENNMSVENSLLKLMKEGELIPSKVGMPRKNVTKDLEKVVLPQTMGQKPGVMNPVAPRTAPQAAQSSLPSAAESEGGGSQDVDVGRMLQYGAYQQAGNVADKLLGIQHPGDETGTLPGAVAGGVKAGMGAAKKIGSLFGGGKKQPEAPKPSSGMPPSDQNTQQNYYSRDIK